MNLCSRVSDSGPSGCDAIQGEEDKKPTTDDPQLNCGQSNGYSYNDLTRQRNGLVDWL